jgi:hypothetical protein
MTTPRSKIVKPVGTEPDETELAVAQALFDLEANSAELKSDLKALTIVSAKEVRCPHPACTSFACSSPFSACRIRIAAGQDADESLSANPFVWISWTGRIFFLFSRTCAFPLMRLINAG